MYKFIRNIVSFLEQNKMFTGVILLITNVFSKYIEMGFSETQKEALRNGLAREIIIFSAVFLGTRDIIISFILTASFVVLSNFLLNEKSSMCIIPNKLNSLAKKSKKYVTQEEKMKALDILRRADMQEKMEQQREFTSYLK